MRFDAARKQFLNSARGVDAAKKEFEALRVELQRLIESVKGATGSIALHLKASSRLLVILGLRHWLSVRLDRRSRDSLELEVSLWDDHPPFPGVMLFGDPRRLRTVKFKFDLLSTEQVSWVSESPALGTYTTNDLAPFILKYYTDNALEK